VGQRRQQWHIVGKPDIVLLENKSNEEDEPDRHVVDCRRHRFRRQRSRLWTWASASVVDGYVDTQGDGYAIGDGWGDSVQTQAVAERLVDTEIGADIVRTLADEECVNAGQHRPGHAEGEGYPAYRV
jgi:hypothetical protein